MSYVNRVVNLAFETIEQNKLTKISEVQIELGEMTGVVAELMDKCYQQAIPGTILEGSILTMTTQPVVARCLDCGNEYEPSKENDYSCTSCHSHHSQIIAGKNVVLQNIIGE